MTPVEIAVYVGVVVGVLMAFILPWVKKNADLVAQGFPPENFAKNYIYAFVVEGFIVLFTIGTLAMIVPFPDDGTGLFSAFFGAFIYGIVSAYSVKLPFDWLQSSQKIPVVVKE